MHFVRVNGAQHPLDGSLSCGAVGAQLGQHRVVVHADFTAFGHAIVDADARANGRTVARQGACARQKSTRHVFGVHAQFERMALNGEVVLGE